jgi:hypothetical protein
MRILHVCRWLRQEKIRGYLLLGARDDQACAPRGKEEDALRQEIVQLKITIDTLARAQLFEAKELLLRTKCAHMRSFHEEELQPEEIGNAALAAMRPFSSTRYE